MKEAGCGGSGGAPLKSAGCNGTQPPPPAGGGSTCGAGSAGGCEGRAYGSYMNLSQNSAYIDCYQCNHTSGVLCSRTNTASSNCGSGGGGGPTPTGGGGTGACTVNKACTSVTDCGANCEAQNWACVGVAPNRTCQQHGPDQCPGGTCNAYIAFHCNQLTDGKCHDNPKDVGGFGDSWPAGCGQIDQVCNGGSNHRHLCGSFTIIRDSCGGGNPPPPPPPPGSTPTPTTPAGPQCTKIKVYKNGAALTANELTALKAGDKIKIGIQGAHDTKARYRINSSAWVEITSKNDALEYVSGEYTIPAEKTTFTIEAEVFGNGVWL